MIYLITGFKPSTSAAGQAQNVHTIFDTEDEAKTEAEKLLNKNVQDIIIWQHVFSPRIKTTVIWEEGEV